MAFATDAQRRWFFAHLATGMRRIAGKMKQTIEGGKSSEQFAREFRAKVEEEKFKKLEGKSWSEKEGWQDTGTGKLTRAQAVKNLMAGKSSGVEASKKRKQNAARRARYQLMKDLYGHRTRSGGWE